jgi:hypothetical protein
LKCGLITSTRSYLFACLISWFDPLFLSQPMHGILAYNSFTVCVYYCDVPQKFTEGCPLKCGLITSTRSYSYLFVCLVSLK